MNPEAEADRLPEGDEVHVVECRLFALLGGDILLSVKSSEPLAARLADPLNNKGFGPALPPLNASAPPKGAGETGLLDIEGESPHLGGVKGSATGDPGRLVPPAPSAPVEAINRPLAAVTFSLIFASRSGPSSVIRSRKI